jgi:hypothetical protein
MVCLLNGFINLFLFLNPNSYIYFIHVTIYEKAPLKMGLSVILLYMLKLIPASSPYKY